MSVSSVPEHNSGNSWRRPRDWCWELENLCSNSVKIWDKNSLYVILKYSSNFMVKILIWKDLGWMLDKLIVQNVTVQSVFGKSCGVLEDLAKGFISSRSHTLQGRYQCMDLLISIHNVYSICSLTVRPRKCERHSRRIWKRTRKDADSNWWTVAFITVSPSQFQTLPSWLDKLLPAWWCE